MRHTHSVNKLVLRLSFGVVLLMGSCLACGFARAQSSSRCVRSADSESRLVVAAPSFDSVAVSGDGCVAHCRKVARAAIRSLRLSQPIREIWRHTRRSLRLERDSNAFDARRCRNPRPNQRRARTTDENPNKWQLGIAFALVRFRSSVYYASAPGFNSSLAYWWKDWVAIEGSVTSAFAPPVFENEHFRYLSYGAGPKFSFGHGRLRAVGSRARRRRASDSANGERRPKRIRSHDGRWRRLRASTT